MKAMTASCPEGSVSEHAPVFTSFPSPFLKGSPGLELDGVIQVSQWGQALTQQSLVLGALIR